ncbi:hypothetical protein MTO96_014068 [Rhipicephalus appendiculatus]
MTSALRSSVSAPVRARRLRRVSGRSLYLTCGASTAPANRSFRTTTVIANRTSRTPAAHRLARICSVIFLSEASRSHSRNTVGGARYLADSAPVDVNCGLFSPPSRPVGLCSGDLGSRPFDACGEAERLSKIQYMAEQLVAREAAVPANYQDADLKEVNGGACCSTAETSPAKSPFPVDGLAELGVVAHAPRRKQRRLPFARLSRRPRAARVRRRPRGRVRRSSRRLNPPRRRRLLRLTD